MDALGLAALQIDAGRKDHQTKTILKHLRHKLGRRISVPFLKTKQFSRGYVRPKIREFEHQYDNGEIVVTKESNISERCSALGANDRQLPN